MPYDEIARYRKQHGDDAQGEIVHKHLEAGAYLALDQLVELPHAPAGNGTHDHGTEEHGSVRADNHAHRSHRSRDAAPVAAYVLSGGEGDQHGEHILQHRGHHPGHVLVGPPPAGDENGRDKAPGYESADIRHHHSAQGAPEFLNLLFHMNRKDKIFLLILQDI